MDLMTLTAKLTLSTEAFDSALAAADQKGKELAGTVYTPILTLSSDGVVSSALIAKDAIKDVTDEATSAQTATNLFTEVLSGAWQGIKDAITLSGVLKTINNIIDSAAKAVNYTIHLSDSIDKGAKSVGVSTKFYQEWGHALGQNGANIADLSNGISSVNSWLNSEKKALEEVSNESGEAAEKTEEAANAFTKLGISAKNTDGSFRSTEQVLEDTILALAEMENSSERASLVEEIFGKNKGKELNALLDEGSTGIKDLIKEANDLGLVLSDESISKNVELGDKLSLLQKQLDAIQTQFAESIVPYLIEAVGQVDEIIKLFTTPADKSILTLLSDSDKELEKTQQGITGTQLASMTLVDKLMAMGDATKLTAEQFTIWQAMAEKLVTNIPELSTFINTQTGEISANTEELKDNIKAWAERQKQQAADQALADKREALANRTKQWLDAEAEANLADAAIAEERAKAVTDVNKVLKKYGSELRVNEDGSNLSDVVQQQQKSWANNALKNKNALEDLGKAYGDVGEAIKEAEDKQAIADSLKEDVEKGKAELQKYEKAIEQALGGTDSDAQTATTSVDALKAALDGLPETTTVSIKLKRLFDDDDVNGSFASGSNYIPYDMTANLHRGETVLSASQARDYREGSSSNIDLSALSNSIVSAVQSGMANATVNSYIDGKKVTNEVNKNTYNQVAARRYVP